MRKTGQRSISVSGIPVSKPKANPSPKPYAEGRCPGCGGRMYQEPPMQLQRLGPDGTLETVQFIPTRCARPVSVPKGASEEEQAKAAICKRLVRSEARVVGSADTPIFEPAPDVRLVCPDCGGRKSPLYPRCHVCHVARKPAPEPAPWAKPEPPPSQPDITRTGWRVWRRSLPDSVSVAPSEDGW